MKILISAIFSTVFIMSGCSTSYNSINTNKANSELYKMILTQDSLFFNAYNNCDMKTQEEFYSDGIEFYHDQAGLITSKKVILEATKNNICDKITRKLIREGLEIYPINGFGAVEIGYHQFISNHSEISAPSRFLIIWQNSADKWLITKIVSLH